MEANRREIYIRHCIENLFTASEQTTSIGVVGMWLNRVSHDILEEFTYGLGSSFSDAEADSEIINLFSEYFTVTGKKFYCKFVSTASYEQLITVINRKMLIDYHFEAE